MARSKDRKPVNPGVESTILIDHKEIIQSASAYGDVAVSLANNLSPYDDPRLNVIFTNGALALELYFKSQLIERIFEPAHVEITPDGEVVLAEENHLNPNPQTNEITILHSRLQIKDGCKTHKLAKLYRKLSQNTQNSILNAVTNETSKIQTDKEMLDFLKVINDFFVIKRYHFEAFLTGVEGDRRHLHTLLSVLKGVKSALADV